MSFTIYNLIYFIICIVEGLIVMQYMESVSRYEGSAGIRFAAFFICYGILFLFVFITENFWFSLIPFFVLNILLAHFIYAMQGTIASLHAAILTGLLALAQWMMQGILQSLSIMTDANRHTLGLIVLSTVFGRLLYLIFVQIIIWINNRKNEGEAAERTSGIAVLCISSAATCWGTIALIYVEMNQLVSGRMEWMVISGALCMLLANIIIYWSSARSRRHYRDYMEAQLLLEKENADVAYYRMLAERSEEQKIMIHDVRKHMNALSGLLDTKNYEQASAYIKELMDTPALQPGIRLSDNRMANLIFMQYQERCKNVGIQFYPDVREKSLDFLSPEEITALLANLLDNALEAAEGAAEAFIQIKIGRRTKTQTVMHMVNSCRTAPGRSASGQLLTSKQDAAHHGFGMKSIEKIVKRHHGTFETHYDAAAGTFHTTIVITAQR